MVFEGKLSGKRLVGITTGPDGTPWQWTGERAPSLKRKSDPKWGKPTQLFNGRDLNGWRRSDPESRARWKVEDGALVSPGHGPELITDGKFEDFKLHVEFDCAPGPIGVYLRGRYELQIEDDPEPEGLTMRTGGVYGFLAASPEQPRKPGEWQTYDITLVGRVVTVVPNGQTIIDKQEIPGITGGPWIVTKHCPDRAISRVVSWPRRFSEHHDYANEVIWSHLPYEAEITLDRASLQPLLQGGHQHFAMSNIRFLETLSWQILV